MDEIKSTANKLLQMGDDILEVATAYMDFVHPICLDIQRHGIFNEEKMAELKSKLNDKLFENKKKLLKEFDVLTNPRQTEEWMMLSLINVIEFVYFYDSFKKLGKLTFINYFNLLFIKNCYFNKWVWRLSNFVWSLLFIEKKNVLFSFITVLVLQILKSQFKDCKERVKTFAILTKTVCYWLLRLSIFVLSFGFCFKMLKSQCVNLRIATRQ